MKTGATACWRSKGNVGGDQAFKSDDCGKADESVLATTGDSSFARGRPSVSQLIAAGITALVCRYDGCDTLETVLPDRASRTRFEQVVLPHLDAAYNLARWLTRDAHDADDVVQEACVRALKYVGGFHGTDGKAWFLTIVRHACYDWFGRNRPAEIAPGDATDIIDSTVDPAAVSPEQSAINAAEAQALADAIAALPVGFREILVLREIEELSYKEIARIVDIPIGTVMSRLARARALLQRSPLLQWVGERLAGGQR